jgi:hypothetical protein
MPCNGCERYLAHPRHTLRFPLRYFPAALAAVSEVCRIGNEKHNPGEEMHHARGKSNDHADCIVRHLVDLGENGGFDENGVPQVAYIAWRALALCQEWLEANACAPLAPGARVPEAEANADPLQGWKYDPDFRGPFAPGARLPDNPRPPDRRIGPPDRRTARWSGNAGTGIPGPLRRMTFGATLYGRRKGDRDRWVE